MTTRKDAALSSMATPVSQRAMTRPATAGPTIRPLLKEALLSATALLTSSASTISETKDCRAGASMAAAIPVTAAATSTSHRRTQPPTVSTPRTSAAAIITAWVTSMMTRLGYRSASAPDHGARRRKGANCRPVTVPRAVAEWSVSWVRTSQSWPTRPIQVPVLETREPPAYRR